MVGGAVRTARARGRGAGRGQVGLTPGMPPHWRLLKARLEDLCPKSLWITSWNRTNPADVAPFLLQVPSPPHAAPGAALPRSQFLVRNEVFIAGRGRPNGFFSPDVHA